MNQTFLGKIIATVVAIFHKVAPVVDQFVLIADSIVNELKVLEASNIGQFLETTLETLIPASTGLVSAFKLALPKVAGILTAGAIELGKTDQQKMTDLISYLSGLKTSDPVLYAGTLNTLNASIQQFLTTNSGVLLSVPQSLMIAQVAHNPTLA